MALIAVSALLFASLRTEVGRFLVAITFLCVFPFTMMAAWEILVVRRL
jgi:hypothetical protein